MGLKTLTGWRVSGEFRVARVFKITRLSLSVFPKPPEVDFRMRTGGNKLVITGGVHCHADAGVLAKLHVLCCLTLRGRPYGVNYFKQQSKGVHDMKKHVGWAMLPVLCFGLYAQTKEKSASAGAVREVVESKDAPKPIGPYSQAIKAGGFVFCAGQIALDPTTGQLAAGDITVQTERVLKNLSAVLAAAGTDLDHAVKTTVFLKNISDFPAMNEVYGRYFKTTPPARSTVAVAALPRDALVEIEVVAGLPGK